MRRTRHTTHRVYIKLTSIYVDPRLRVPQIFTAVIHMNVICALTEHSNVCCASLSVSLSRGMPVDCCPPYASTLLIRAVECGNIPAVRLLILYNSDVNMYTGSPVRLASRGHRNKILCLLIAAGADVNMGIPFYVSAVLNAINHGRYKTLYMLLCAGAVLPSNALLAAHQSKIDTHEKIYIIKNWC